MKKQSTLNDFINKGYHNFLPSVSLDNVIFGFHDNQLKVLLLKSANGNEWMLPGGFIANNEPIDEAAARVLLDRTGLNDVYLQQFHTFGQLERKENKVLIQSLKQLNIPIDNQHWLMQRFVTIGYFALVEYAKVNPRPDDISIDCQWHDLDKLPLLIMDHTSIIEKALEEMRFKLKYQPIGYNLLPKRFTIKELRSIYETILSRKLDRANFNRKMNSYGILDKKEKLFSGGSHKAPFQYSFNKERYFKALENGLGADF